MNAIEQIKALKRSTSNNLSVGVWNAAITKVLAILEEEKPVDPCAFAVWIMKERWTYVSPLKTWHNPKTNDVHNSQQLLEIYKQTLK